MDTTAKKIYTIGTTEFVLREYGDLTGHEEDRLNKLLTQSGEAELKITGYEAFEIILVPVNPEVDVKTFDWPQMKNKQIAEILIDWIVEKKTSMDTTLINMMLSAKKKSTLSSSLEKNLEK